MKKEFVQPNIEVIRFDKHEDIITCSGGTEDPGCGHGHSGNGGHHNQWPTFPWWPWHW